MVGDVTSSQKYIDIDMNSLWTFFVVNDTANYKFSHMVSNKQCDWLIWIVMSRIFNEGILFA